MIKGYKKVYSNKWIKVVSKNYKNKYLDMKNLYSIDQRDYVNILLKTKNNKIALVKQFRHAIEKYSLEFPGGLLEKNETPLQCAKREILEETGCTINKIIKISQLYPDVGRLSNKLHLFFAISNEIGIEGYKEKGLKVFFKTSDEIENLFINQKILHQPCIGLYYLAKLKKLI